MSAYLEIVKELTGEVIFRDAVTKFTVKELQEDAALFLNTEKRGGIWIVDKEGREVNIQTENILRTQVLPSPVVNFTGDSRNLYELLETSFFYNLVNPPTSGSGVVESNILLQGSNYTILTSDYIIVATANITLTLPASPNIGQLYKIYANNNTVQVDRAGSQTIIGQTSVSIKKYSSFHIQYVSANNWLII